jgi:hypothetical protein
VVRDDSDLVVAYAALVVGRLSKEKLSSRARSGLPVEVPDVLIAKLAVDRSQQGNGPGGVLLGHAGRSALAVRRLACARLSLLLVTQPSPPRASVSGTGFRLSPICSNLERPAIGARRRGVRVRTSPRCRRSAPNYRGASLLRLAMHAP